MKNENREKLLIKARKAIAERVKQKYNKELNFKFKGGFLNVMPEKISHDMLADSLHCMPDIITVVEFYSLYYCVSVIEYKNKIYPCVLIF